MKQNTITVMIANGIIITAYLTNDVVEIYGELSANAEKLIRLAIRYWLNQEVEEYKGLLDNEPLKHISCAFLEGSFAMRSLPAWQNQESTHQNIAGLPEDSFVVIPGHGLPDCAKKQAYCKSCADFLESKEVNCFWITKIELHRNFDSEVKKHTSYTADTDIPGDPCLWINGDTLHYQCDEGNDW